MCKICVIDWQSYPSLCDTLFSVYSMIRHYGFYPKRMIRHYVIHPTTCNIPHSQKQCCNEITCQIQFTCCVHNIREHLIFMTDDSTMVKVTHWRTCANFAMRRSSKFYNMRRIWWLSWGGCNFWCLTIVETICHANRKLAIACLSCHANRKLAIA